MSIIDIRRNEREKVFLFWSMNLLLAVGYTIGWAAVHAMLVKRMGVEYLPYTYIAISILTILGSSLYLLFADTVRRDRLFLFFCLGTGACLVLARFFVTTYNQGEIGFSWHLALFFTLILGGYGLGYSTLGAQVWTMINDIFRPNQGRRLYPVIGTAHTVGGITGGFSISMLCKWLGTANLVMVWAASLLAMVPLIIVFQKRFGGELRGARRPSTARNKQTESKIDNMKQGFRFILSSPLMQLLSMIALLFWVVGSFQDFQYTRIMNLTFTTEERLSSFYGYYAIGFNITALILHLLFTGRIIRIIGVGRSLCVLPVTILIGLGTILVRFTFIPGLLMRYAWDIIGMTLQGNAYQLVFNAVPGDFRGRVRGFLEGVINPLGGILGGLVIIIIGLVIPDHDSNVLMLDPITLAGLLFAGVWLTVALTLKKKYIQAVIDNLRSKDQQTCLDAIESLAERGNKDAMKALLTVLESENRDARIKALLILPEVGRLSALRQVSGVITDPDTALRVAAVKSLRNYPGIKKQPFLNFNFKRQMEHIMVHDESPEVRGEAAKYLMTTCRAEEMPLFIQTMLDHEDPVVRCKVIETAAELGMRFTDFSIESALEDEEPLVKASAVYALWPLKGRKDRTNLALQNLIDGKTTGEKIAGFRTAVKLGVNRFLSQAEKALNNEHPEIRSLGALIILGTVKEDHPMWDKALNILVSEISDPDSPNEIRKEIVPLLHNLPERGIDAIIIGLTVLSETQREHAADIMKDLYSVYHQDFAFSVM